MIEKYFDEYRTDINQIIHFLEMNFGKGDYLKMKNSGILPNRNYEIKNSTITGYSFHGYGCSFQFKKRYDVDVEFHDCIVGFTSWGFRSFLAEKGVGMNENEVSSFLNVNVHKERLKYSGRVYYFCSSN